MGIGDIFKIYLLIGIIVITLEWILLVIAKEGVFFEKSMRIIERILSAPFIFLIEVLIWPRQAFVMFYSLYRLLAGKCSYAELMEEAKDDE